MALLDGGTLTLWSVFGLHVVIDMYTELGADITKPTNDLRAFLKPAIKSICDVQIWIKSTNLKGMRRGNDEDQALLALQSLLTAWESELSSPWSSKRSELENPGVSLPKSHFSSFAGNHFSGRFCEGSGRHELTEADVGSIIEAAGRDTGTPLSTAEHIASLAATIDSETISLKLNYLATHLACTKMLELVMRAASGDVVGADTDT
ncbi:Uu.00g143060.m01.CDS01 [Anthostomella pinea]|uniref:Uu.00g143060.m01.CDS01 n=1 Tax=Anthostomella pinea TaxID=933095 RepID=A0AAI8VK41_9PEZI|nr:Uu.00g143060.m01.CDS01 [Anthostomella pinea]